MRKIKRLGVFFLLSSIFIHSQVQAVWIKNINDFVKEVIIVDKKIIEETGYLSIDVDIPQINHLNNEIAEKVINKRIEDSTYMWIKETKDIVEEYFGESSNGNLTFPYQLFSRFTVTKNKDILSMYIDYYQYTGGAHGITNRVTYNIDLNTGNEIQLKDLFKPNCDFNNIINAEIHNQIKENPEFYFQGDDGFNGIKQNQEFFLMDEYLIIQFQHYEIAPYASGMPEFKIPLKLFKDNFIYGKM